MHNSRHIDGASIPGSRAETDLFRGSRGRFVKAAAETPHYPKNVDVPGCTEKHIQLNFAFEFPLSCFRRVRRLGLPGNFYRCDDWFRRSGFRSCTSYGGSVVVTEACGADLTMAVSGFVARPRAVGESTSDYTTFPTLPWGCGKIKAACLYWANAWHGPRRRYVVSRKDFGTHRAWNWL